MSPTTETQIIAADRNRLKWDTSFADWEPGPGNVLLRAYSDAVNKRLLGRWLPERCGHILKTDLFDEVAGDGLVGFLLTRAEQITGIDVAPTVVEMACARHPRLVGAEADVRSLPYADGTFDVVISPSTLDHFDHPADLEQALHELHRVLRPDGLLIVTLDNASNPLVALRNILPFGVLHRVGLVPYPVGTTHGPDGLRDRVRAAGFTVNDVETIMHVPRVAVRSAGRAVAGNPARFDRLLAALLRVEPPGSSPLRRLSGQFVAVHASRRPGELPDRPHSARTTGSPTRFSGGSRAITMRVLGRTAYRQLTWMALDLEQRPQAAESLVPLDFGFLDASDLDEITAFRPGLSRTEATARLGRGDRCFGAWHDGRLASTIWIATGSAPIEYLGVARRLPASTSYLYDRYIDPSLRGLRIAPATGSELTRVLAGEGTVTVTAAVHADNAAAMTNALRVGLRPVGIVGSIGFGPIRRSFSRPRRS